MARVSFLENTHESINQHLYEEYYSLPYASIMAVAIYDSANKRSYIAQLPEMI